MGATAYILPEDLPKEIRPPEQPSALYEQEFAAVQKSLFERILRETGGNRAEAAARLGWHQNSLRRRCGERELK